ncbi:MAG TPA: thiamine pyrophosphate-binding protein [Acetobacteraceae bacterium]|jgi:acetolactate synthase-1/2/3 large subunit|nr:thiamine pyrophosphate-binding protein [Acetobacteraceae bacterium]
MKLYEAIADSLVAEGVDTLFGLMGDGNMSLWGALGTAGKINIISSRNEAAAVAMADGYAKTTGKVGVATVTCGPGLTQVGTSLLVAARGRAPIVLIIGEIPKGAKNNLQSMDQRKFVEACEARFVTVTSVDNAAEEIAEAFYAARVHRTPVVLNLPIDLQEKSFDWDWEYRPSQSVLPPLIEAPSEAALTPVMEKLAAAERPVIIAGRGARQAKDAILRLAARTGALLATSLQAKGLFSGEEYDLGISGAFASAPSEALLADADFVLAVGAELGYYTSEGGLMFPQAEVARIDIRPYPDAIGVLPGLYVRGDAGQAVTALEAMLASRQVRKTGFRTAETKATLTAPAHAFPSPNDGLDPRVLARQLSKALPKGILLTSGAGHFFSFPAMYTALPAESELQLSYHFGAVGQGLPVAIGVGAGNPGRPHVAIEGDGSLMMNLQELDTVTRYNMQMVLIIWNDGGFGAEVHKLSVKGFDVGLAQWRSPDFVALAKSFGGDGVRLTKESDIGEAVATGLRQGGLYLIDARVSPTTASDPYSKVHHGIENHAPRLAPHATVA